MDWLDDLFDWCKEKLSSLLVGIGIIAVFILLPYLWHSSSDKPAKPPRDTAARIALAKAELDEIKATRGKDGKPGNLNPMDLWKPEVVLPVTLALIDNEYEKYGIFRVPLTKEIKAHPEKFKQDVPEIGRSRFLALTQDIEKDIGDQEEHRLTDEVKLYRNAAAEKRVNGIAEKIIALLPVKPPLKVILVKDQTVNACCLSNGTIFGLFDGFCRKSWEF